jgi:predicted N-formylglutamate amidohydrolase
MGLLGSNDPPPVIAKLRDGDTPFLFTCDHAGREAPAALAQLGLAPDAFERHIAWDIGAAAVTHALSAALGASFVMQRYSRLVIDCNRDPGTAAAIPAVSDHVVIPGNQGLDAAARQARIEAIHTPYHAAVAAALDRREAEGRSTILVFMHSFTPRMDGFDRPWRFGVIREPTSRFSERVLQRLRGAGGFQVGDNLPYAMDGVDYSAPTHAFARGLDYLELEMRQDTVADAAGQAETAALLQAVLTQALADL